ncbi:hypothetical protein [Rhizobium rhododendri]|uniref:Uncharacterized protein n=1 Tax=Rhizobium rhododendri TaxID=2506430 RepID=A0ABY8IS37_9HYPH|nr:hypothetical protein [Rhizobium rhododendri]WFS26295.1 hypothetical protein PR018_25030 [Rhizobium rhododendri]
MLDIAPLVSAGDTGGEGMNPMGSDEHFDLSAFEFFHKLPSPPTAEGRRPILTAISASSRRLGN